MPTPLYDYIPYRSLITGAIVLCLGALTARVLIRPVIALSRRYGFIDAPDRRRIHSVPTPRAGGLIIFAALQLSVLVLLQLPWVPPAEGINAAWWTNFSLAASLILIVGLIDDSRGLSPRGKLAGQIAASLLLATFGIRIDELFGLNFPPVLDYAITVCWLLFVINAFNLIDGIDGLATGLAGIGALGMVGSFVYRHMAFEALLMFAFIGVCLGFLSGNRSPARIFLGDSGSHMLGLFLGSVMVGTGSKGTSLAYFWVPLLVVSVPALDVLLAVWRRTIKRVLADPGSGSVSASLAGADLNHLHHRLLGLGLGHRDIAAVLYLVNAIFVFVGLLCLPFPAYFSLALACTVSACFLTAYVFLPFHELRDSAAALVLTVVNPVRLVPAFLCYLAYDLTMAALSLYAALRLAHPDLTMPVIAAMWLESIPVWGGSVLFLSIIGESAPRVVSNITARRLIIALACTIAFAAIGADIFWLTERLSALTVGIRVAAFLGLVAVTFGAGRLALRVIERNAERLGEQAAGRPIIIPRVRVPWLKQLLVVPDALAGCSIGFYFRLWPKGRDEGAPADAPTWAAEEPEETSAESHQPGHP